MMASMFSAGIALLVSTSASPSTVSPVSSPEDRMRIVRIAASEAAREDAVAYLETERKRSRTVPSSLDERMSRRTAGYDVAMIRR